MPIFNDNQSCIAIAKDPSLHHRAKHIDVRYHYIRELITYGKTTISYISTGNMLADILTKPLPETAFQHCLSGILTL